MSLPSTRERRPTWEVADICLPYQGDWTVVQGSRARGAVREPDVCVLLDQKDPRRAGKYRGGADFVIEVVSRGGEQHDYLEKPGDYADARIPEYWIVDPFKKELLVLRLTCAAYAEYQVLGPGEIASSIAMTGFQLDVGACFAAADRAAENDEPEVDRL